MIDHGTTTAVDTSQVQHTPEHTDAGIRGSAGVGPARRLRLFARCRASSPVSAGRDAPVRTHHLQREGSAPHARARRQSRRDDFPQRRARPACRPSRTASITTPSRRCSRSRALRPAQARRRIHPRQPHERCSAWKTIKDTGGHISVAVPIEMTMGHGLPPIQDALDHGMRPSLSSDVDVTMAQDAFTQMRAALTLQRWRVLQRARTGAQNLPALLTCRDVLEFATVEGARCTGSGGKQDRHADAWQGRRHRAAQGRPAQRLAAQQRPGRGGQPDESRAMSRTCSSPAR